MYNKSFQLKLTSSTFLSTSYSKEPKSLTTFKLFTLFHAFLLSHQKSRNSIYHFWLDSQACMTECELIKSGHTFWLIALKVSEENTYNRYTGNVCKHYYMHMCMHASSFKNKQLWKTEINLALFLFSTVDQCGYELSSICEAIQSIQDEFVVPLFTGCDLHSVPGCHRIYHYVRRCVSKCFVKDNQ